MAHSWEQRASFEQRADEANLVDDDEEVGVDEYVYAEGKDVGEARMLERHSSMLCSPFILETS